MSTDGLTDGRTDGQKEGRTDEPKTIVPFDFRRGTKMAKFSQYITLKLQIRRANIVHKYALPN